MRKGIVTTPAGLPALCSDGDLSLIRALMLTLLLPGLVLAANKKIQSLLDSGEYESAWDNEEMLYLLAITAPSGKSSSSYLKEYMQKFPRGKHIDPVRHHLADYYAAQGLNITASMIYPDTLDNIPGLGIEEQYRVALFRQRAGEYKSAMNLFARLLAQSDDEIGDWSRLGIADCNLLSGKFEIAIDGYKELLSGAAVSSVATPFALLGISEAYEREGKLDRAEEYYNQYKKNFPSAPPSLELEASFAEHNSPNEPGKIPKIVKAGYFIQVGVFSKKDNARACLKKFKIQGFQSKMEDYNENGQKYYRILLGPYVDEASARKTKTDLEKSEGEAFFLVIE
jgi:tetratricopeptide (TPR) repeat protein